MKKVWLLVVCLVLCLPMAAAAGVSVSGGYLFGGYEGADGLLKGDVSGFMLSGEAALAGPFGILGYVDMLQGRDFSVMGVDMSDELRGIDPTRYDILGTYALPVSLGPGGT